MESLWGEFKVKADLQKNRLYVTAEGLLNPKQDKEMADAAIAEVKKLKPGFDIINDLSKMKVSQQEGLQEFGRASEIYNDMSVGHFLIVVGGDKIARMQIERVSREQLSKEILVEYASSVEEAERMLDSVR